MFEGDGSITINNRNWRGYNEKSYSVSICSGSMEFINGIKEVTEFEIEGNRAVGVMNVGE